MTWSAANTWSARRVVALVLPFWLALAGEATAAIHITEIPLQDGPPAILLKGSFALSDDPADVAQVVRRTGARVVTFDSSGGNVAAAISYGRMIRSLGLITVQPRSSPCVSACALAFVGGVLRQAEAGAIGVHQASFSPEAALEGHGAVAAIQSATAIIMSYLVEMGVDPRLLELSLATASDDMRYLTAREMENLKVTNGELRAFSASARPSRDSLAPRSSGASISSGTSVEERALAFMRRYHEAWSMPNGQALAFMESAYANSVMFYGKSIARTEVLSEKRKFAARWPNRTYFLRAGTEWVQCTESCVVKGVVDWLAENPAAPRTSSGSAEFTLVLDGTSGRIISESGSVIARKKAPTP